MDVLLTIFASGVMPILAIALVVWAYRHNLKKWRSTIDAQLQVALSGQGVDAYTLIVDKLTPPGTNRTADVYRILHDNQDRYFLFIKTGEHPGVLKPLTRERALLAASMNG
ncbi:hypothetical protein ASF84_03150 [Pseudomonas sp. Leaf127]|uniref:hypothetical protein n=1 Tax=Pseudomonas sp. Leaf127 TaxID=1736267 RepID=UPI000703789B|nr:hypothetical protein [Pseudomonas sp. Leaf127]KQQ68145.1 hypothetical protein ASF84_03150 [Pseudomonas sp. Leaf127]